MITRWRAALPFAHHVRRFISSSSIFSPHARLFSFSSISSSSKLTSSLDHGHGRSSESADPVISSLLSANKSWAAETAKAHPDLFPTLAQTQKPQFLWLGCADSRVPETTLCACLPGNIFVHRNIANVIHPADINTSAVIEYAVAHLKVEYIIVCGHDGCGGVKGALGNAALGGVLDNWLSPVREVRMKLEEQHSWKKLDEAEKVKAVVEENVREGVRKVRENVHVIEGGDKLKIVGLCYNIADGKLRSVDCPDDKGGVQKRAEMFCEKE